MKQQMIKIGSFFFKYRDKVFPILVLALFLCFAPIHTVAGTLVLERAKDILAVAIVVAGLAYRGLVIGYAYIKRGGLNKEVYADKLVTEGLFTLSRNPLYLGNMLICIGIFLMHGHPVVVSVGIALYWFIYQCIIYTEEKYLADKFGSDYEQYCQETPRWIPILSRLRTAVEGMEFSFKRVIIKDYGTMATSLGALILIKIYEHWTRPQDIVDNGGVVWLIVAFMAVIAAGVVIRVLKKKNLLVE
ncbi:MAG: DUF1295 domain-containing protein [Alphaproteobacteria bacterium]|nr:DUF1295 domain-containing protein [Alphaproteobacteria bacterium]